MKLSVNHRLTTVACRVSFGDQFADWELTQMTFEEATLTKKMLEADVDAASLALNQFPKGRMGLTPDSVKSSDDFKAARKRYSVVFLRLQTFNRRYFEMWRREIEGMRSVK